MIAANVPALLIATPLIAGLLVAALGRGRRAWWMTVATTTVVFGLALMLLRQVLNAEGQVVHYTFGEWWPLIRAGKEWLPSGVKSVTRPEHVSIGIDARIDALNALVLTLVAGMAAVVTPFARRSIRQEVPGDRLHLFYAVFLLSLVGLLGITITGDAFNLYVLLEISSLTSYALVALGKGRDRRALTAAYQYLVMGTVGASFLLVGIGYLFMATGTLNMAEMQVLLSRPEMHDNRTVIVAFALIAVGLTVKAGMFPLHQWLPNAYTYAPSAVTAFFASTATKVGIYVALRFWYTIFPGALGLRHLLDQGVVFFSCVAILHGSLMAIQQTDLKRLLAYSSVAQIGYMGLGIGLGGAHGLTGSLMHLLNHALVKGALFIAVGCVIYRVGRGDVASLKGLARRMPFTACAIVVAGAGLVGVPLTGGFLSKWYLVSAALEAGDWLVAVTVLLGSLLAVVYVLRLIEPMIFAAPDEGPNVSEAPALMWVPAWILALASVSLGLGGQWGQAVVLPAANALLEAR